LNLRSGMIAGSTGMAVAATSSSAHPAAPPPPHPTCSRATTATHRFRTRLRAASLTAPAMCDRAGPVTAEVAKSRIRLRVILRSPDSGRESLPGFGCPALPWWHARRRPARRRPGPSSVLPACYRPPNSQGESWTAPCPDIRNYIAKPTSATRASEPSVGQDTYLLLSVPSPHSDSSGSGGWAP
jgi:hypothetical protein